MKLISATPSPFGRKGNDALDDWYAVFSERDSMKTTAPE